MDYFKFKAKAGQALAFEIETPDIPPARFNPRLGVSEANGQEVFANIYKEVGGDGDDWISTIEPKTLYTFTRDGEYFLQIRDLTFRYGNPKFTYRILIRPQIPHLGGIAALADRMNLGPGRRRNWRSQRKRKKVSKARSRSM